MRNKRKINLTYCNFNFQNKNSPNTNRVKVSSPNFKDSAYLQESSQIAKQPQKAKTINYDLNEKFRKVKQPRGITLIALVVTIVVLLVLAGVSISTVLGNNGIMPRANEAKFKTELASIQEEFTLYVTDKTVENSDFSVGSLNASLDLLTYNTQPDEEKGTGNISTVLKSSTAQKYIQSKSFSIIKGDLIYASQNAKELEWAREVGLAINPYNIDENGVLLSSDTNLMLIDETTGTLVIPEMVTAIGEGTFGVVKELRRVVIPPTVKEIKQNAFADCTNIEEVVFQTKTENGVEIGTEKIGANAFRWCTSLRTIRIPDTVTEIGSGAWCYNTSLSDVVLPKNIKVINSSTLRGCKSINNIIIPPNVEEISAEAFEGCTNLASINIPEKLRIIRNGGFSNCVNLKSITIERRK